MTRAELPAWVAVNTGAVRDMVALATYWMRQDRQKALCTGMVAAAGWVMGSYPAPVTGDMSGPEPDPDIDNARMVEAESWAAGLAGDPHGGLDMTEVCRVLDVPLRLPRNVPTGYAAGVFSALQWMLGMQNRPPLPLPWRGPDGLPVTVDYVYDRLVTDLGPVDETGRATLREEAARVARESTDLAKLVSAQRRYQASAKD